MRFPENSLADMLVMVVTISGWHAFKTSLRKKSPLPGINSGESNQQWLPP